MAIRTRWDAWIELKNVLVRLKRKPIPFTIQTYLPVRQALQFMQKYYDGKVLLHGRKRLLTKENLRVMKLVILLLTVACLQVSAESYAQQVTLKMKNIPIEKVFEQIYKQTGYQFVYTYDVLKHAKKVNVNASHEPLEKVLEHCFKDQPFTYELRNKTIVLKRKPRPDEPPVKVLVPIQITGRVTDSLGNPLAGVTIKVKNGSTGEVTGAGGRYSITAPDDAILVVSYIGYITREIPVKGKKEIDIVLKQEISALDQLVVVGYGMEKKNNVISSIATIKPNDATKVATTDLGEMLRGKAAGVQITSNSAAPGGSSKILIRGQRSINGGNNPLIVLDGVPVSNINYVSPSDIASIQVLKDAAAQAIYGARAANGVILITTKKGQLGKLQVSYNGYYGTQWIKPHFKLFNGPEYVQLAREANRTINGGIYEPDSLIFSPSELESIASGKYINWINEVLRTAPIQNHSISFSTGTDKTKVYASVNYQEQNGVIPSTNYKKGSMRLNINQTLSKWLKLGINSSFQIARRNELATGGILKKIVNSPPLGQIYNPDGSLKAHPNDLQDDVNPLLDIHETSQIVDNQNNIINFYLNIKPIKGLNYRINASRTSQKQKATSYSTALSSSGIGTNKGSGSIGFNKTTEWQIENVLSYKLDIQKNNLNFTFVQSADETNSSDFDLDANHTSNDILGIYGLRTAESLVPSIGAYKRALLSYAGRIEYNYSEKYYLTISARADGSSVFGANNKWGFFPAAAAGWNIYREPFMDKVNVVSYLKIRTSYGSVGNQAISPYGSLATADQEDYIFGSAVTTGYSPGNTLPNPNLKWETSTTFNIGIDFGLWGSFLSGSLQYYDTRTRNLLINRLINAALGYTNIKDNIGEVGNQGFELQLNSILVDKKDLNIRIGILYSSNRNKILNLYGGIDDVANKWFIGYPINIYYQLHPIGLWQESDDIKNSWMPDAKPGDIKIKDVNKDGKITAGDEVITSQDPKWYGTFSYNMTYKNIDLSMDIYVVQGIIKENPYMDSYSYGGALRGDRNQIKVSYWTPEHPDAEYPRPTQGNNPNYISTMGLENASYIRLQNITLGYTLSHSLLSKINLNKVRVYVTGHNLFTQTKYHSYDPEASPSAYPPAVSIAGGVQITF